MRRVENKKEAEAAAGGAEPTGRLLQLDRVMHLDVEPPTLKRSRRLLLFTYRCALNARWHTHELICVVWMCARRLFAVLTVGPIAPCHLFAVR
jgi:hypothetical protein